ncbi:MAG: hypothetical protein M1830_009613 [Pleopsidium flavum]|nr:MAG: hypothetical protein M1830_009613 [Pleopsidium flavum]
MGLTSDTAESKARIPEIDTPWHSAYPTPKNPNPAAITRNELLQWLNEGLTPGKDFVLVNLRRADHEGGTIRGSLNLPAQSLYSSIPTLYTLFSAAGVKKIIFYCGSSRGRGTRAAGWFEDYILDRGNEQLGSYILAEGIAGWAAAGDEYTSLMDEYQKGHWQK